jgi:hypothetical protein
MAFIFDTLESVEESKSADAVGPVAPCHRRSHTLVSSGLVGG